MSIARSPVLAICRCTDGAITRSTVTHPIDFSAGNYARKQIYCPSRVVAWSHRSRFRLATELVAPALNGRLLDYGCGDGTFIGMVHEGFALCVGGDNDVSQLDDCRLRLASLHNTQFLPTDALGEEHSGTYDVVTCMEVLEHCSPSVRLDVIAELRRLVSRTGRVIVSLPIEIGPALVAKQVARRIAAWRRLGDYHYSERYTLAELIRMTFVPGRAPIAHVSYEGGARRDRCYGHKGFDWRIVERELSRHFHVAERRFSPMPLLGCWLNSQAWMVCLPA